MHVSPGYRENRPICKLHVQFFSRISRLQERHNENWHAHYSLHAHSMITNTSMSQRNFTRGLGRFIFLASVSGASCVLTGFACALMYTLLAYKPTAWPVASHSLYLDIQIVALLLEQFSLFARANLYYPTTRVCLYFSTVFWVHLRIHTLTI